MKKVLTVVSILMLILGAVTLVTGAVNVGLLSSVSNGGAVAGALITLTVVLFVVGGLLDVVGGFLGLRAAKNPAKATGAVIFGVLALATAVASVALSFSVQSLCGCVVPLIYFLCAVAIRSGRA